MDYLKTFRESLRQYKKDHIVNPCTVSMSQESYDEIFKELADFTHSPFGEGSPFKSLMGLGVHISSLMRKNEYYFGEG